MDNSTQYTPIAEFSQNCSRLAHLLDNATTAREQADALAANTKKISPIVASSAPAELWRIYHESGLAHSILSCIPETKSQSLLDVVYLYATAAPVLNCIVLLAHSAIDFVNDPLYQAVLPRIEIRGAFTVHLFHALFKSPGAIKVLDPNLLATFAQYTLMSLMLSAEIQKDPEDLYYDMDPEAAMSVILRIVLDKRFHGTDTPRNPSGLISIATSAIQRLPPTDRFLRAFRAAVDEFGHKTVAEECAAHLGFRTKPDSGALELLLRLHQAGGPELYKQFKVCGVYCGLVAASWRIIKSANGPDELAAAVTSAHDNLHLLGCLFIGVLSSHADKGSELVSHVTMDCLGEHDLILLLGKLHRYYVEFKLQNRFLSYTGDTPPSILIVWYSFIRDACKKMVEMETYCDEQWKHVFFALRTLYSRKVVSYQNLNNWLEFGYQIGLQSIASYNIERGKRATGQDPRVAHYAYHVKLQQDIKVIGCNYLKCPSYQEEVTQVNMLRCTACESVCYCSVYCQKGDWKLRHCEACYSSS